MECFKKVKRKTKKEKPNNKPLIIYLSKDALAASGMGAGVWAMGMTAATAVILTVTGKLALYVTNWTVYQAGIMLLSVAVWFVFLLLMALLTAGSKVEQKEKGMFWL